MASILDSEAEFTKRCSELLPDDQKDKLQAQDVKTFGTFAFSVAEQQDIRHQAQRSYSQALRRQSVHWSHRRCAAPIVFEGLTLLPFEGQVKRRHFSGMLRRRLQTS